MMRRLLLVIIIIIIIIIINDAQIMTLSRIVSLVYEIEWITGGGDH